MRLAREEIAACLATEGNGGLRKGEIYATLVPSLGKLCFMLGERTRMSGERPEGKTCPYVE